MLRQALHCAPWGALGFLSRQTPRCEFYRVVDLRRLQLRRRRTLVLALAAEAVDSAVRHPGAAEAEGYSRCTMRHGSNSPLRHYRRPRRSHHFRWGYHPCFVHFGRCPVAGGCRLLPCLALY